MPESGAVESMAVLHTRKLIITFPPSFPMLLFFHGEVGGEEVEKVGKRKLHNWPTTTANELQPKIGFIDFFER